MKTIIHITENWYFLFASASSSGENAYGSNGMLLRAAMGCCGRGTSCCCCWWIWMCGFFSSSLASSSEESAWGRCFFTAAFFAGAFFATAACFVVFFIVRTRIKHCCQFSLTSLEYLVELGTKVPIQKNCLETHYRSTLLTFFFAGTAFKVPLLTTPDFSRKERA